MRAAIRTVEPCGNIVTTNGLERLREGLSTLDSLLVAYSGGVDSTLLAAVAHELLGDRMLAVMATSDLLGIDERAEALSVAAHCGFPVITIPHPGASSPEVLSNQEDRCYICKHGLMVELRALANERGLGAVAHGENADDRLSHRPGMRAATEMGALAPLATAGMSKNDVREAALLLRLPNALKPSAPCLATRVPYGTRLDPEILQRIAVAEQQLRTGHGYDIVRVRVFDGEAVVEIGADSLSDALDCESDIRALLGSLGFASCRIDPEGYRSGRWDVNR